MEDLRRLVIPAKPKKSENLYEFAHPADALGAGLDVYAIANSVYKSALYGSAIAGTYCHEHPEAIAMYYDVAQYQKQRFKNTDPSPDGTYDNLEDFFSKCPVIVWAHLSFLGSDLAREIDTIIQQRFTMKLLNIITGWHAPKTLADVKDVHAASLANPYPLLHERASDASMMYHTKFENVVQGAK